jgi:hypothetical protein
MMMEDKLKQFCKGKEIYNIEQYEETEHVRIFFTDGTSIGLSIKEKKVMPVFSLRMIAFNKDGMSHFKN